MGLIGPNGAGKSTLLKIIANEESPDSGDITRARALRIGYLKQEPSFRAGATIFSCAEEGLISDERNDAHATLRISETLSKLELNGTHAGIQPETPVSTLSGGWKKRVALARELVKNPTLLLLDEPTNHLDVETIEFLERFLSRAAFAVLTITHDRRFLDSVATRILELDRRNPNGMISVDGGYSDFVSAKEALLESQVKTEDALRNILRRETEWLKRGAKARTTKQQARITRAEELKESVETLASRNQSKTVNIDFQASDRKTKKLIEASSLSKTLGDRKLVNDFSALIRPGTRLALLGPNGAGKTTLIRLLTKTLEPDAGQVSHAPALDISVFEQHKEALDANTTVMRTLCPTGDYVHFQGRPLHIRSYLDRFLFEREHADIEIGRLSGGERSRVLIARLMLRPAQVLVLDEPTNDLDLPTLSVLEETLSEFTGAVIFVSHDRWFTERVATEYAAVQASTGKWVRFSSLEQYDEWRKETGRAEQQKDKPVATGSAQSSAARSRSQSKRLSYKDQREYDSIETTVAAAEVKVKELTEECEKPEVLANHSRLTELTRAISEAQAEVDRLYARWAELEEMSTK